jgi:hypothetical protein
MEQIVFLFARRADATGRAPNQENRADRNNDLRQVGAEMRKMSDEIMEM